MNESQTMLQDSSIPIIQESDRRLATMRARLQDMYEELRLVGDVISVSIEAMDSRSSDVEPEVGRVLFQYGAERLYEQLESLTDIIEQLGGRTELTEDCARHQAGANREANHVDA
jgi:hypothetical protein